MNDLATTAIVELEEVVRSHVDDVDRDQRLPQDLQDAIRASGLNRMLVPSELGGDERPVNDMVDVIERIARIDGSTAWCAAIGAGTNLFAGYVAREAAAEVWKDVDAANASMFAPLGRVEIAEGDARLSGRWPCVSNCEQSSWIGLGAFPSDGPPRLYFVRAEEVTVHKTWDVNGMVGTGSHDVSAERVVIDASRSCSFGDTPWPNGPLWRVPLFNLLAPQLAAVALGIANGALATITASAETGHPSPRGRLYDDDVAMAELAAAVTSLAAAREALHTSNDELFELATSGTDIQLPERARGLLCAHHTMDVAEGVTMTAHRLAGSGAVYRAHHLARALADVIAARQHVIFSHHHRPALARALLGHDVSAPPFF